MSGEPVAIVTASGKGIGAAIARELASGGYRLALMSNGGGARHLAGELGGVGIDGSVTDPEDLQRLVDDAVAAFGRVDAVVNNTGHPPTGPLLDLTDEDWHSSLDLVFLNVVRMARLVTPIMIEQGSGSIVNISTFSAFEPCPAFPISSSLRLGLAAFTKLYADRYAQEGIRMNNILPGFVDSYPEDSATIGRIPAGRYGHVEEIAKTVFFLLSDDAGYLTGQNLRIDGGLTKSV